MASFLSQFFASPIGERCYNVNGRRVCTSHVAAFVMAASEREQARIAGVLQRVQYLRGDVHAYLAQVAAGI
jgi:hypothetical protein